MNVYNCFRTTRIGLVLSFALSLSLSNAALAQGNSAGGNPALLAAIQKMQADLQIQLNSITATINSLTTSVTNLQSSIDSVAATTETNVRVTAPIPLVDNDTLLCAVSNVSAATKTVRTEMISDQGVIIEAFQSDVSPLLDIVVSRVTGARGFFMCRFTVLNGIQSDIRGMGRSNINLLPFTAD